MENRNQSFMNSQGEQIISSSRTFIAGVFSWMFLALLITAVAAYLFSSSSELMSLLIKETGGLSALGYLVMFAPLGLVLLLSFGINKLSFPAMSGVYILYSLITGISLSFILLAFTSESIFKTFLITSAMFGTMAVMGYTTKMDLTRFGSILSMFLVGLVIAMVVNIFMKSGTMSYIIDIAGILIFTGLTAYDMQRIKTMGENSIAGEESTKKMMLMGALTLYLDFINMFLFLLRLFGSRK
ncbi:MAG: Bax inhibitor-1/YccA family protein [Bacteroidota bacterium]